MDNNEKEEKAKKRVDGIVDLYKALRDANMEINPELISSLDVNVRKDDNLSSKTQSKLSKKVRSIDKRFEKYTKISDASKEAKNKDIAEDYFND